MNERCLADKVFRRDFCAHCLLLLTELHSGALLEGEICWRVKVCFPAYRNFLITVLTENKFNWLFSHRL